MEGVVNGVSKCTPANTHIQRILVTGAEGYIGATLMPLLHAQGYAVEGLDTGYYRAGWLYHDAQDKPRIITRDTRVIRAEDLYGYDAIVHLAELSNDPTCEIDESLTYDINHRGSVRLAEEAKKAGVGRFIYASSCSVYGAGGDGEKTEASEPNPQTAYARCKLMVERDVAALADRSFVPTFLRNATAFGPSPRMRFDIVLNNLAGLAWTKGKIQLSSDGTPWRPLVHVMDIGRAVIEVLNAPSDVVFAEIFNVGCDRQNYRVRDIAEAVSSVFPECDVTTGSNQGDNRSYRVSFAKIRKHFPAYTGLVEAKTGARQLRSLFERIRMTRETFEAPPYTRLKQLQALRDTRQLDGSLYWQPHAIS